MREKIFIVVAFVLAMPLSYADVGIGLTLRNEQAVFDKAFFEGIKCENIGVYNPFDTDVDGIVSVSGLEDFLVSINPEKVSVDAGTMPNDAVQVQLCFKNSFFRQFKNFLGEMNENNEKIFKGSVAVKSVAKDVGFGSSTGSISQLPFSVVVKRTRWDYVVFILTILIPVAMIIFVVRKLRESRKQIKINQGESPDTTVLK